MSEQHPLDPYVDLIGKVSPQKLAETAGVELAEVEAWLAERDAAPEPASKPEPEPKGEQKPKGKHRAQPQPQPAREAPSRRRIEAIKVLQTTAISVENARGQRLRIPVPRSIYRGELARKYAQLLREDEFRVIEYSR